VSAAQNPGSASHESTAGLSRRDTAVLLTAAASLQAVAWAVLLWLFSSGRMGYGLHELADTLLYHFYSVRFLMGHWPYADVPVEYPPLANLVFLIAPSGGTVAEYERWFSTGMIAATVAAAVVTTAAAAVCWRSAGRALAAACAYALLTLSGGALAANRYDAVVALVVAVTMLFLTQRSWTAGAAGLGVGFALKFTPALLLPLALLLPASGRRRLPALAAFALAAVVPFVPFALHDPSSVAYPFAYHSRRPLQLESVPGTPWVAGALFADAEPAIVSSFGSQNFAGRGADLVARASPWLLLVAVGAVYALLWRRREALRHDPGLLPLAALSVLLVAMCTSKVLSPQFLIWTFPVVAPVVVQPARLAKAAGAACVLATLLTQVEFPARYWRLVALEPGPAAILVARNVLLVAAAILAVAALARLAPGTGATHEPPAGDVPVTARS
jgi:hypothetical protein